MLKETIVEAIAQMYSTTPITVSKDIFANTRAKEALVQFCEAMEEAGY